MQMSRQDLGQDGDAHREEGRQQKANETDSNSCLASAVFLGRRAQQTIANQTFPEPDGELQ